MCAWSPRSTPTSPSAGFCPTATWSTRATQPPGKWSPPGATTRSTWWAPILASTSWQTKDGGGFSQADFTVDGENRRVACPNGKTTDDWLEDRSQQGAAVGRARFPMTACRPCEARAQCTRAGTRPQTGRRITLRPRAEQEVIQRARAQEDTQEWKEQYAHRASVEGTISQVSEPSACDDADITAWLKPGYNNSSPPTR
jgi:hypothetical protein